MRPRRSEVLRPAGAFTLMVALRTIAGVPGSRSTARTHCGPVVCVCRTISCVSSVLSAAMVNGDGIGTTRSGVPSGQLFSSETAGGGRSPFPIGLPPVTQTIRTFSSRAVNSCGLRNVPAAWSVLPGGMCPAMSSVRIDSPQGNASL